MLEEFDACAILVFFSSSSVCDKQMHMLTKVYHSSSLHEGHMATIMARIEVESE